MAKRTTVMIDDDIMVKVRKLQSEMIKKSEKSGNLEFSTIFAWIILILH